MSGLSAKNEKVENFLIGKLSSRKIKKKLFKFFVTHIFDYFAKKLSYFCTVSQ
jgi:hypothetical protein